MHHLLRVHGIAAHVKTCAVPHTLAGLCWRRLAAGGGVLQPGTSSSSLAYAPHILARACIVSSLALFRSCSARSARPSACSLSLLGHPGAGSIACILCVCVFASCALVQPYAWAEGNLAGFLMHSMAPSTSGFAGWTRAHGCNACVLHLHAEVLGSPLLRGQGGHLRIHAPTGLRLTRHHFHPHLLVGWATDNA